MSIDLRPVLGAMTERRHNRPHVQVATMTAIAYFTDPSVGAWARDRVHALAVKHPSRVVVLDGTRTQSYQNVETVCDEHVDCVKDRGDWIELGVEGMEPGLLCSVLAALTIPEAPSILIWVASGIAKNPCFAALSDAMRTIVLNTSILDLDTTGLRELVDFARPRDGISIADLAYLRLHPWQEAIAQFFDRPDFRDELHDLRRVDITCGSDPEAYYLLGWLGSRLGWTPSGPSELQNKNGDRVEFAIERKGLPRRILRVRLASPRTTFLAEVDNDAAEAIVLTVQGEKTHPSRARPINNIDLAALVERAILTGRNDPVFRASLLAAGDILARRGN
jgi:glucose-6-phosphate dehydrogenase assembly protein OpcA